MSQPIRPRASRRRSRNGWTRRTMVFVALPILVLALVYVVATIDIRSHDGRVLRSVSLGPVDVGGMDAPELEAEMDRLTAFVETAPVYIETPGAAYQIDAERLGLTLDRNATRAAVLAAGRDGSGLLRPLRWVGALFSPREVEAVLRLDPAAAEAGLAAVSKTISVPPGAPTLVLRNGRLELEAGTPGSILDVERLVRDLSASLPSEPGQEITVRAYTTTEDEVDVAIVALIDRINTFTQQPVELVVGDTPISIQPEEFRAWVRLDLAGAVPAARLDTEMMYPWINAALGIAQPEIDTRALIVNGSQIRLPESNAVICCSAGTGEEVLAAVLAGTRPIPVNLLADDVAPLVNLGIADLIGEFTTPHPAGEDRVINIQRMADIVRGAIIEPGATFSLNDYVGERTRAKGFVPAGVIYEGVFTEDVGGGVSQFATTMFNASFFAGLDLVAFQAHSIYIDRYPYGREATVNWPGIDLKVRNPTEFPVLIWTEYTRDSITVKLFGTAVVRGEQTDQTTEAAGECTRVRTERTRTWLDGRVETDYVGATYQPREGVGCDGQPTKPPPTCELGETLVDADGDGLGDSCEVVELTCPPPSVPADLNGDGVSDSCDAPDCPTGYEFNDTDGDGVKDLCEPIPTPTPAPTATPAPTVTPVPTPTAAPTPGA